MRASISKNRISESRYRSSLSKRKSSRLSKLPGGTVFSFYKLRVSRRPKYLYFSVSNTCVRVHNLCAPSASKWLRHRRTMMYLTDGKTDASSPWRIFEIGAHRANLFLGLLSLICDAAYCWILLRALLIPVHINSPRLQGKRYMPLLNAVANDRVEFKET